MLKDASPGVYFGREEGVQSCNEERPTWLLVLCVKKQMESKQSVPPVRRPRRVRCESTGEV